MKINHIKGHPDVYLGLCGARESERPLDEGFVSGVEGKNRCEACVAKANDPKFKERQLKRWKALISAERLRRELARAGHRSFSVSEGMYSS